MESNAQQAKIAIELKAKEIAQNNPLFVKARTGTLSRGEMGHYLANLRFMFSHAPGYFERAAKKAQARGLTDLANFYLGKLEEERGHEAWADDDLKNYAQKSFSESQVTPETKSVVRFVNDLIDEDPRLFLSHLFFTEYFTVLAAPEFFKNIEQKCGINRTEVSAIAKHEEADRDHSDENFDAIKAFVSDQAVALRIQDCINLSADAIGRCMASCIR